MLWPAADALSNNFSVTPPAILNRLNKTASDAPAQVSFGILKQMRHFIMAPFTVQRTRNTANV
jgi:hypothetical protein